MVSSPSATGASSNGAGGEEAVDVLVLVFVVTDDEGFEDLADFLLLPRAILPQPRGQQEALAAGFGIKRDVYSFIPQPRLANQKSKTGSKRCKFHKHGTYLGR